MVAAAAAVLLTLTASPPARAAEPAWRPGIPPPATPWTAQVAPGNALPEYPRPQLARDR